MSKSETANMYADVIISEKLSIREVAQLYGVSKSTVNTYIKKYATGIIRKLRLKKQLQLNKGRFGVSNKSN